MALSDVRPNSFFQFIESSTWRRLITEQRFVDILGCVTARTANHNLLSVLNPFQNRARINAKPASYLSGH